MPNFKILDPDGIPNLWLKQLDAVNNHHAWAFNKRIHGKEVINGWVAHRGQHLPHPQIWKNPTTSQVQTNNLSTNNIQTFDGNIHRNYVRQHLPQEGGQEAEEKGCKRWCYRTTSHPLINKGIVEKSQYEKNQIIHSIDRRFKKKLLTVFHIHGW